MLALAFAGCACRAAFHAGVAAALSEARLPVALTAGASSGSLIAVGVAAGRGAELPAVWRRLGGRSIVSLRRIVANRSPFDMSTLVRTTLEESLGAVAGRADLRGHAVEGLVTATRLRDLRPRLFSTRDEPDMIAPLLASCFFPLLYGRTVRVRGELYVDGGLRDNLPLEALVQRGAREIIAVVARPDGTALKTLVQQRWRPRAAGAKVYVIAPSRELQIRSWDLDQGRIERALEEGHRQGRRFVAEWVAPHPSAP
jgi:NTE family protein